MNMDVSGFYKDWPVVTEADFDEFLKGCPDYVRDGCGQMSYRHNGEVFAYVEGSKLRGWRIKVDPKLLVT